jgi:tight adherence protein C
MSGETGIFLVQALVFASVTFLVLALTQVATRISEVRRRRASLWQRPAEGTEEVPAGNARPASIDLVRYGWSAALVRVMRADLVRAGFFAPGAVTVYAALRVVLPILLPPIGILLSRVAGRSGALETSLLAVLLAIVGLIGPKAYLSWRGRSLSHEFRLLFPNFLDMLVVCVNAGLSLEAALDRAGRELGRTAGPFRSHLDLLGGEMRAGKSTTDALRGLANRLAFREAQSFAALLGQTLELGTDVAQALTTFADEMRDKRMAVAEEKAAALPPKLTLPLGLFIFPVVLVVVLAPAVMKVLATVGG